MRELADLYFSSRVYPDLVAGEAHSDREIAHERFLALAEQRWEGNSLALAVMGRLFTYRSPRLEVRFSGITFPNPLGVAAGFDKNARVFKTLGSSGFGYIEVGSITKIPYKGNDRPRLFALPESQALINRMGFPGDGLSECLDRVNQKLVRRDQRSYGIGLNVAASRPSFDKGTVLEDYREALAGAAQTKADYLVVNLSSPNTPGVRGLQEPDVLEDLLTRTDKEVSDFALRTFGTSEHSGIGPKPIFLKIAPDLTLEQVYRIMEIARGHVVHGFIATNTTTNPETRTSLTGRHKGQVGGISGSPLNERAELINEFISQSDMKDRFHLFRSGGVMSVLDCWNAISFGGADAVQVLTALVDESTSSPLLAYRWNRDLDRGLRIVGKNVRNLKGSKIPLPPRIRV